MPILDFSKLTPDNQAVKDLKDLIEPPDCPVSILKNPK